ncbi:MAG TPA: hypothetical protein VFQ65_15805 [Kofleriaceae bacterium]|nr:hypothetical protein [Kofleriaceae bacterium]
MSESTIYDLGYKRYVGTRRPSSTRWRVIARHQIAAGWQTFWRYKAWLGSAVIVTVIAAVFIFIATDKRWHLGHGIQLTFANMALPFALDWYGRLAFIISLRIGATVIAADLQSGAFTFYFARSTRPIDYLFGKLAGVGALVGAILIGAPLLVALMRIGLAGAGSTDELVPQLWLVPKVLAIGCLATLAYTTVPLAFSALVENRRYALGVWAAWYLIAGPVAYGIGRLTHLPLAALDIAASVKSITLNLLDAPVTPWGQSVSDLPSLTASVVSLCVQITLAIAIVLWRLDAAQRSGVGGAT